MKTIKKFVGILCILCMYEYAYSSHMIGGDITYTCTTTPGTWHIKLTMYRDCSGIKLGGCDTPCTSVCTVQITIAGLDPACSSFSQSYTLTKTSVSDVNPNPLCPNAKSICTNQGCVTAGTFQPGVEKYTFERDIDLGATSGIPTTCCNIRMYYQECCRNAAITTGSANQNFYFETVMNRCLSMTPCNNSPVYMNDPFILICGGVPTMFNNGAFDPDGDSLSYAFTPSLTDHGYSVTYTPPYTAQTPLPFYAPVTGPFPLGLTCDSINGDVAFTAPYSGSGYFVGVVAFAIKQWKTINGVPTLIATTRRDWQVWMQTCPPDNPPTLVTNPAKQYINAAINWEVCAGDLLCFDVIAKDTDFNPPIISDTTYLTWDGSLARYGATFLPKYIASNRHKPAPLGGPREDMYQFCWRPDDSLARTLPYYISVTAKDSRCPNPGFAIRSMGIKVIPRAKVNMYKTDMKCGNWTAGYFNLTPTLPVISSAWHISKTPNDYSLSNIYSYTNVTVTPSFNFSLPGKYLVELLLNTAGPSGTPCTIAYYDTITANLLTPILPDTSFSCNLLSVKLKFKSINGNSPYTYKFFSSSDTVNPLNTNFSTDTFILNTANLGNNYFILKVTDYYNCSGRTSTLLQTKPIGTMLPSVRICTGNSYTLDPGNNKGNIRHYQWNTGDTTRTITRKDSNVFIVNMTDTNNCSMMDTLALFVNNAIIPKAGNDTAICYSGHVNLHATGGQNYVWRDLSLNTIIKTKSAISDTSISPAYSRSFEVTAYTIQSGVECSNTDTMFAKVIPLPVSILPASMRICGGASYTLDPGNNSGNIKKYVWNTGDTTRTINRKDSNIFIVKMTDSSGCSITDSLNLFVNKPINAFAGNDTNVCISGTINLLASGGQAYQWKNLKTNTLLTGKSAYPNTSTFINSSTSYEVNVFLTQSGLECSRTDTMTAFVIPKPALPVITGSISVPRGQLNTFSVSNNAGSTYNWMITNGSINSGNGTNSVSVVFNNMGIGNLKVIETAPANCRSDTGSKIITVGSGVGISDLKIFDRFNVYPNPTTGILNIELTTDEKNIQIEIFNMIGKLVKSLTFENITHDFKTSVQMNSESKGVYFVNVKAGDKSQVVKVTLE